MARVLAVVFGVAKDGPDRPGSLFSGLANFGWAKDFSPVIDAIFAREAHRNDRSTRDVVDEAVEKSLGLVLRVEKLRQVPAEPEPLLLHDQEAFLDDPRENEAGPVHGIGLDHGKRAF